MKLRTLINLGTIGTTVTILTLLGPATANAAAAVIYQTGFEPATFSPGTINGQDGWGCAYPSQAVIETVVVESGLQAVGITPFASGSPTAVVGASRGASYNAANQILTFGIDAFLSATGTPNFWTAIDTQCSGASPPYNNVDINIEQSGQIHVFIMGTDYFSGVYVTRGAWNHYELDLNFINNTASAFYNGAPLVQNISFSPPSTTLELYAFYAQPFLSTDAGYFDNFSLTSSSSSCDVSPPNTDVGGVAGSLQIVSGSGSFSSVSGSSKVLNVSPGTTLSGIVNLHCISVGCQVPCVAPLIWTPSWGVDSNSWQLISASIPAAIGSDCASGTSDQQATVLIAVPTAPGVYYIIFAFGWEIGGDHVASGTNWGLDYDVWNDGNDIAEFSAAQISQAQANGWAADQWLGPYGSNGAPAYVPFNVPADAITLVVNAPGYVVTTSSSPSAGGTTTGGGTYSSGTVITATATPSAGWSFASWTQGGTTVSTSSSYSFTVTGNEDLVANFVPFTVTATPAAKILAISGAVTFNVTITGPTNQEEKITLDISSSPLSCEFLSGAYQFGSASASVTLSPTSPTTNLQIIVVAPPSLDSEYVNEVIPIDVCAKSDSSSFETCLSHQNQEPQVTVEKMVGVQNDITLTGLATGLDTGLPVPPISRVPTTESFTIQQNFFIYTNNPSATEYPAYWAQNILLLDHDTALGLASQWEVWPIFQIFDVDSSGNIAHYPADCSYAYALGVCYDFELYSVVGNWRPITTPSAQNPVALTIQSELVDNPNGAGEVISFTNTLGQSYLSSYLSHVTLPSGSFISAGDIRSDEALSLFSVIYGPQLAFVSLPAPLYSPTVPFVAPTAGSVGSEAEFAPQGWVAAFGAPFTNTCSSTAEQSTGLSWQGGGVQSSLGEGVTFAPGYSAPCFTETPGGAQVPLSSDWEFSACSAPANSQGANLANCDFQGSNLSGKNLQNADLQGANLQDANLARANLSNANLQGALLQGANLVGANFDPANLSGANLSGADASWADFHGADLQNAIMQNTKLIGANLSSANLSNADLTGAVLVFADVRGANLQNANLTDAKLCGANLEGAITTGAIFTGAKTEGCFEWPWWVCRGPWWMNSRGPWDWQGR
ncbi:MAG: pentapeptide repeat-containing protein [Verrucomicrobiia bacterium]